MERGRVSPNRLRNKEAQKKEGIPPFYQGNTACEATIKISVRGDVSELAHFAWKFHCMVSLVMDGLITRMRKR